MTGVLRVAAVLIALAAVLDPGLERHRPAPVPVAVHLPAEDDPDFAQASAVRDALPRAFGREVLVDDWESPRALVTIGNAPLEDAGVPVFAIAIPRQSPAVRAVDRSAVDIVAGQKSAVSARFSAVGMRGARTDFVLSAGAARLRQVQHEWSLDNEIFEVSFDYTPPGPGVFETRISAAGGGASPVHVDVPIIVREHRLRTLIYEPRPSWAASFLRQALEASDVFEPITLARTSHGITTITAGTKMALPSDLDALDVVIVSGLEGLTSADEARLEAFVKVRGGALILAPDDKLPERLRRTFELPALEESLLERPVVIAAGRGSSLIASELLLAPMQPGLHAIATVTKGREEGIAVFAVDRGNGQVVVSGLLDAWRFRGDSNGNFDAFWLGVVADAGSAARPPLFVQVDPVLARPGATVTLRATLRETEWTKAAQMIRIPSASAALIAPSGTQTQIRLWPGTRAGEYLARFPAPAEGRYDVRVTSDGNQADEPLIVESSVSTPVIDRTAALRFLAESTGGAVVTREELSKVALQLRSLDRPVVEQRVRPMRSPWWLVAFAGLLTGEWTLRRRRGQP